MLHSFPKIVPAVAIGLALSLTHIPGANAEPAHLEHLFGQIQNGVIPAEYAQHRHYHGPRHREVRRYYGRPYAGHYYRRHRGRNAAGLIGGLAAGAIIGGALASQQAQASDNAVAYCSQRFKSYDPASGTYLGYDGDRHPCP